VTFIRRPPSLASKHAGRQILLRLLATAVLTGVTPVAAQLKKPYRIGYLSSLSSSSDSARADAIRTALRELGYVDGQNIAFEYRYADGKRERFSELVSDLILLKVDIIVVAAGDVLTRVTKDATRTIPIVMTGQGADPVAANLVESLARPGGNVTGLTNLSGDLGGKRLELLKEAVPKITQVAVLFDPAIPPNVREVKDVLPSAARALGLSLKSWEVQSPTDFDTVFAALAKHRPDGVYVPEGPVMRINGKQIADFALKQRLPSVYDNKSAVDAGGLMHYGADLANSYRRVAYYIDKILKGARPADLPVEQPTKFEFVINLKTAKQIGLTIPPNVLARADRVMR